MTFQLLGLVGFQIGWFACVLGATSGAPWWGPTVVLLLASVHLLKADSRGGVLALIGGASLLGWYADTMQGAMGTLSFTANPFPSWISPPWMVALWTNFALVLRSSMSWLQGRYRLGALLGAVGGPASYLAGAHLQAVKLEAGVALSLLVVAAVWAVALPLILGWEKRLSRQALPL